MKEILIGLLMVVSLAIESRAGSIIGTIRAEGKAGAEQDAATGRYASRRYKFVERVNYSELGDFVIYIDQTMTNTVPPSKPLQVITQKDAMFSPHVLPVMVGSVVEWPNYDDIVHNVFSMSDAKQFDLGLYKQPTVGRITFDKVGRVDVFCSIHTRMNCVILVLPNPYFISVHTQGRYSIPNVPAGTYKLKAWHERLPSQTKEIIVPESGEVRVDFVLGITGLPKGS